MYSQRIEKICQWCEKLVMLLLCVLMADCAVFGAGRTIEIGPLGFRMLVVFLVLLTAVPLMLARFRDLLKNRFVWLLAAFYLWLAFETVIGLVNKNNTALLMGDIKGFAYFVVLLPVLCVLTTEKRIHMLMKIVMYASAALAVAAVVLIAIYNCAPNFFNRLVARDSNHDITMFAAVSKRIPRLFFKSTPYFLCGCSFAVYFQMRERDGKLNLKYPVIAGFSLFALLVSYTRSIYFAVAVAMMFWVVLALCSGEKKEKKLFLKTVIACVLVFVLLLTACSVIFGRGFFGYAVERVGITLYTPSDDSGLVGPGNPDAPKDDESEDDDDSGESDTSVYQQATIRSDEYRAQTMAELLENIRSSPIIGLGLGKALLVREGKPNEYIYQDLLMKTGIIGLALFVAPAVYMLIETFRRAKRSSADILLRGAWLAVLLGFMAFSYFNPYMNASLGILFYCCSIGVCCADRIQKEI